MKLEAPYICVAISFSYKHVFTLCLDSLNNSESLVNVIMSSTLSGAGLQIIVFRRCQEIGVEYEDLFYHTGVLWQENLLAPADK